MTVEHQSMTRAIDDLRARLAAHRVWFETGDTGAGVQLDVSADLTDPNASRPAAEAFLAAARSEGPRPFLRNVRLRGLALAGADLSGALLTGAQLKEIDLTGARLDRADLGGATLTGVRLDGASAVDAGLGDYWYDCSAEALRAPGSNLVKAEIYRTPLVRAVFDGADMLGVEFHRCDLRSISLRDADLTRARFIRSDLRGADFTKAQLRNAKFYHCLLAGAHGEFASADGVRGEVYDSLPPFAEAEPRAVVVDADDFVAGLRSGRWR